MLYYIALCNIYPFNITWRDSLQIYLCIHKRMHISTLSAPTRHSAAAAAAARVVTRHSLADHFMYRSWTLHRRRFVGKPNVSECARAYIWLLHVSRVHVRRTKTSAGRRGRQGGWESRVQRIYYDLLADPRSVCHPCPPPPLLLPATASFPPRSLLLSYSPSILVVLRRVTPLSFRRRSKNKVPDSRCMNDNLITEGLKIAEKIYLFEHRSIASRVSGMSFFRNKNATWEYIFLEK